MTARHPSVARRKAPGSGRRLLPYAIIFPGVAFYGLFAIYPLLKQIQISFFNWNIMPGAISPFVGLANYIQALHDPVLGTALVNTLLYVLATVPPQMILGFLAAQVVHRHLPARGLWRTLIYLPVITSWVVVSYMFSYIFNAEGGAVNALLADFFGPGFSIYWLQNTWTAFVVIWLLAVWKGFGWSMVMFLAGLSGLPREVLEAGSIDGAAGIRHWWNVTLPMMWNTVSFVVVMLVMGGVQAFISIYLMTGGGPVNSTQVILTYTYQQAFSFFNFGYSGAMATMVGVVLLMVSIWEIRMLRRTWTVG